LIFTISVPGISIAGHVGGLITGALAGAGIAYAPRANRTVVQTVVLVGIVVLLGGLSLWQTSQLRA
jgi:membrane associated rhomboid family serine protease